ncbi:porin family protein [Algibacter mikhailovii]|uniref:porin family protein n=1 Tax=Algibacter mikhailovii TaxID=425498 RepID=UPI0024942F9F|nr:porin family protein [Algibacter mikhailovii]
MKKSLILSVLLSFSIFSFSQDKESEQTTTVAPKPSNTSLVKSVKWGVRGGLNISNLDFDEEINFENKHRNSFYFGAFASIQFSKTMSLMPELQFSGEGAKAEPLQLDYIQMPILLGFKLSNKVDVLVGPQIGLKVHKEGDQANNLGYSGVVGVEYRINYALFVDARYTYGFRNVFDDSLGISAKNRNFQIGIGYKL